MATTVDIQDQVRAALAALSQCLSGALINPAIGEAEVIMFQKHLISNPPNRFGWPTTNFWPGAARSTHHSVLASAVMISINKQGVRQRYQGGTIKPTGGKKYLTIPARAEAYGRRAGEFNNLRLAFRRENGAVRAWGLVQAVHQEIKLGKRRKDGSRKVTQGEEIGGQVMYWLVESVTQRGNPAVLPDDARIAAVAIETIGDIVHNALQNGGKG